MESCSFLHLVLCHEYLYLQRFRLVPVLLNFCAGWPPLESHRLTCEDCRCGRHVHRLSCEVCLFLTCRNDDEVCPAPLASMSGYDSRHCFCHVRRNRVSHGSESGNVMNCSSVMFERCCGWTHSVAMTS